MAHNSPVYHSSPPCPIYNLKHRARKTQDSGRLTPASLPHFCSLPSGLNSPRPASSFLNLSPRFSASRALKPSVLKSL